MKSDFKIFHIGAENCVTGSCHLLQANGLSIMVDCGLAQGDDPARSMNMPEKPGAIKLVHGEGRARETLEGVLAKRGFMVQ